MTRPKSRSAAGPPPCAYIRNIRCAHTVEQHTQLRPFDSCRRFVDQRREPVRLEVVRFRPSSGYNDVTVYTPSYTFGGPPAYYDTTAVTRGRRRRYNRLPRLRPFRGPCVVYIRPPRRPSRGTITGISRRV